VRLDRNQRQSREEERVLGRNVVHPERDVQPREGYGEGSYRRRGRQITWRAGGLSIGGGYKRGEEEEETCSIEEELKQIQEETQM